MAPKPADGGPQRRGLRVGFSSDPWRLFRLATGAAVLTVLTLGIYRFWMVTALRRHYWGAIRIAGDPIEYTGRGLEKLMGFLIALVLLAIYLSIVNLGLTYLGLSWAANDERARMATVLLSTVSVLPLVYYAMYRAAAYQLARTRWRGIRFGMSRGAWGFALRALVLWVPVILTAGLLYPWRQYRLEKYRVDRAWFGTLRFGQGGGATALIGAWVWLYILAGLMAGAVWMMSSDPQNVMTATFGAVLVFLSYVALFIVFLRYSVVAFRHFWSHRTLGGASFRSSVSTGEIIGVTIGGSLLVALCSVAVAGVVTAAVWVVFEALGGQAVLAELQRMAIEGQDPAAGPDGGPVDLQQLLQYWPLWITGAIGYLVVMIASYGFTQVFITRPILRRQAESMMILDTQALAEAGQRPHDEAAEAGGFADALGVDVGGAF